MSAERGQPMRDTRRLDSQRKHALVLAAVEAALHVGRSLTIAGVARDAGVGRKFIYDHPDLRAEIELKSAQATHRRVNDMIAEARVTGASLRADLENARAQNRRLTKQLRALETRLSHAEGARLLADDLLPDGMLAELADQQLAQRVSELEQQLFETKEELRRAVEELGAARAINRELMQQANRPVDDRGDHARRAPRAPKRSRTDEV